jgi:hypothetical protein
MLYIAAIGSCILGVIGAISSSPIAQVLMVGLLLAVVLVIWLVRRARNAQPSYNLTGFLLVLVLYFGFTAIVAIPLPSALRVPQFIVALVVSASIVWRLMATRQLLP